MVDDAGKVDAYDLELSEGQLHGIGHGSGACRDGGDDPRGKI